MNPIILIAAYQGYKARGDQDACRDTYLKEWGHLIPHRFVYDREYDGPLARGRNQCRLPDGFHGVRVQDTPRYSSGRWSNGYDYVFSAPTDCYIVIPRLLASGYEKLDYTGFQALRRGPYRRRFRLLVEQACYGDRGRS